MSATLTTRGLIPLLLELTEQYAAMIRPEILKLARERGGREILGEVQDRLPEEDEYKEVDRFCEERFAQKCGEFRERGLRVWIVSEHYPKGYGDKAANIICHIDPFDGTDQFSKGIWEAWYSVFSFTTPQGKDLYGGCIDFIAGVLYVADAVSKKVLQRFLDSGEELEVFPSSAGELSKKSVAASYKGKWQYLAPWFTMVEDYFARQEFAGVTHYSWGGSFVYALLAAGVLQTYIMPKEPTDEIRPGRAFVVAANLFLASVTEAGTLRRFPWGQKRRVSFFIAAANERLARSIIRGIWRKEPANVQSP